MAQTSKQAKHKKLRHSPAYQEMLKAYHGCPKKLRWLTGSGGSNGRFKQL